MSSCEFHPEYQKHLRNNIGILEPQPLLNLQDELQWGLLYRDHKKKEIGRKIIPPKKSPIDIPLKICRERQKRKQEKDAAKKKKDISQRQKSQRKLSLLEKSMLSQEKYMEYLSTPNPKYEEPPPKKRKKKCLMEPCSPRLVRLATPNKRRVYANWKDFYDRLPTEMLLRFEEILYENNCLKPRDARYYYKQLDKEKKKQRKKKKLQKIKKLREKERGDQQWAKDEIDKTVKAIMDFIKEEPLFVLNYKQLLLSDGILNLVADKNILKKPKRNSKKPYKSTLIEISDKLALWMDTLIRFVDVQPVESDQDIPPISISSLEISSETEEEEEEEETEEERREDEEQSFESSEEGEGPGHYILQRFHQLSEEYEEGEGIDEFLGSLDDDQLDKLIKILSNCTDEFLDSLIDPEQLPDVTYRDVLDRLIELKKQRGDVPGHTFMEKLMVEWAMHNDPDKVDSKLLKKIKETAAILEESFRQPKRGGPKDRQYEEETEEEGEEDISEEDIDEDGLQDPLEVLVKIVSKTPDEYLQNEINPDLFPGIKYKTVLKRLNKLKDDWDEARPGALFLEGVLVKWAKSNEPELDKELLKTIRAVSVVLEEWLKLKRKESGRRYSSDIDLDEFEVINTAEDYRSVKLIDTADDTAEDAEEEKDNQLNKLIELLEKSPEEILETTVSEEKAPDLTHKDLLNQLNNVKQEIDKDTAHHSDMEEILINWVNDLEPRKLTNKLRAKIKEVSLVLDEWIKTVLSEEDNKEGADKEDDLSSKGEAEDGEDGEEGGLMIPEGEDQFSYMDFPGYDSSRNTRLDFDLLQGVGQGEDDVIAHPRPVPKVRSYEEEEEEEEEGEIEGEEKPEVSVLYEKTAGEEEPAKFEEGEEGIIKGHKPRIIMEHSPNTVCCLSLKIWAVWLLDVTHNAHSWTKWVHELIKQIRGYAAIVRGDVILPNGEKKVLLKKEWRDFINSTEEKIIAWRQYSAHVKELSVSIIENFHGKKIVCCPKCLQDHLIKNVVTAHQTLRALTEAMNCAAYWRRNFDNMVEMTANLSRTVEEEGEEAETESSESESEVSLTEQPIPSICKCRSGKATPQGTTEQSDSDDEESIYEFEELEISGSPTRSSQQPDDYPRNARQGSTSSRRKS